MAGFEPTTSTPPVLRSTKLNYTLIYKVAQRVGLEPTRSNPISEFNDHGLEDRTDYRCVAPSQGFEPQLKAPKASVLPLHQEGIKIPLFY